MKVTLFAVLALLSATASTSPVSPLVGLGPVPRNPDALHSSSNPTYQHTRSPREQEAYLEEREAKEISLEERYASADPADLHSPMALEKRKGGGGGGRGGGSSSGGGSSGGRSGSGSSGRPISSYSFSPQSNIGGKTIGGSGPPPAYPGGRYAGGATVPYTAGGRSPSRGIAPYAFPLVGFAV